MSINRIVYLDRLNPDGQYRKNSAIAAPTKKKIFHNYVYLFSN